MKKLLSFFICFSLCACFALPAFASQTVINGKNYTNLEKYNFVASGFSEHTIQDFIDSARSLDSMSSYSYYFAYPFGVDSNGIGNVLVICSNVSKLEFDSETRTLHTPSNVSNDFGVIWTWNVGSTSSITETVSGFYVPDDFPLEKLYVYTNMTFENVPKPFNPNDPPDPFTYSISPNNFTLQNYDGDNGILNVTITYTQDYLDWLSELNKIYPDVSGAYNFIIYISPEFANDKDSFIRSYNKLSYIKLFYGEYQYEGGVGYAYLSEQNTDKYHSVSGKSADSQAQGAHIVCQFDPVQNPSFTVPIKTENIIGSDGHMDCYLYVFGAYNEGIVNPNLFDKSVLEGALTGHSTTNDTFSEFYNDNDGVNHSGGGAHYDDSDVDSSEPDEAAADDGEPIYSFHSYYLPFECVPNCKGDLFQGSCKYVQQEVNGKSYHSGGTVSDFTNKSITPDLIHDVDMSKGQWVKYEEYPKWQEDYYNSNKYNKEFAFNKQNLKDIMDDEGDFFSFIKSAFSVFPDWVLNIFIGFLVAMFGIVLLKFIL